VVLQAILARGLESSGAVALARFENRSRRGAVDESRSNQHGALARGAPTAAGSSLGRVHAERGSADLGRSASTARQAAGPPADGTAVAGRTFEPAQVRIWTPGASMAAAPAGGLERRCATLAGSRSAAASRGHGISQSVAPLGARSL